ncbi:glycine--tRNA ligase subunit beta [Celerinatantimonas sp. MCCC 1A17872]|uniref:glycine--tRNA ligase subunit beta n=1 Tax=Celerinatantimonas sp. MCCC 1A17872 TaxID=3177514 RepID=UPI0038C67E16
MSTNNLLVEIGTEELPPKALRQLAQAFADNVEKALSEADLAFGQIKWYGAPRRLAILVSELAEQAPDKIVEKRGPAIKSAFDGEGNPTKAAMGWARSNGIEVADAERLKTDKGEWLLYRAQVKGEHINQLIPNVINEALAKLPIPKPMRWGARSTQFIRPVHTVTMLYGEKLIQGEVLGIESARTIRGHRFMGEAEFQLTNADEYVQMLDLRGKVIVDYERRKAIIREQIEAEAARENGTADIDEGLLEEVTSLVEWPVAMVGSFEEKYLEVPAEALIYTMKDNQKYFPILDQDGKLLPRFIFIANIVSKDPIQVVRGNEKVVRPRLADAEFFYNTDRKIKLEDRLESLGNVVFQQKLGTLLDKSRRIASLAEIIAKQIDANAEYAKRAALLCKTDLMSEMVMEFTDIQGTMGMYYARHDGEPAAVAEAIGEHYQPRFSGDKLPQSKEGAAVAIADKIDTLAGIFAIKMPPKGDKDPFALRRAALGVIRIITEQDYALDLLQLFKASLSTQPVELSEQEHAEVVEQLMEFIYARLRAFYQEQGVDISVIQAVLARHPSAPTDIANRLNAVSHFRSLEPAEALASANKRVANILAKNEAQIAPALDESLFVDNEERQLAKRIDELSQQVAPLFDNGQYTQALTELASLREPVDEFFVKVMVMADDPKLAANRLALLAKLRELFLKVADISLIQN